MKVINPPQNRIFESHAPFKYFFYEDNRGWILPDTEKIKTLALQYDFVVANCSTEHWGSERDFPLVARVHDILADHFNKDFVCLCHDPSDEIHRSSILYFPFWAWWRHDWIFDPVIVQNNIRRYLFSNLNSNVRDFRIACYLALIKKPYANRCLITALNTPRSADGYDNHLGLTDAEETEWATCRAMLPTHKVDHFGQLWDLKHPGWSDSYVHLVSETTVKDKIFITEKTWKPIAAGQLFIIWGNQGIVSHLRTLGVDVFDDVIDHGYDHIVNHRHRLDSILHELDRLAKLNFSQIYKDTLHRRQSNSKRFCQNTFIEPYLQRLDSYLPDGITCRKPFVRDYD